MKSISFKFVLVLVIVGALMFVLFRPFAYAVAMALVITLIVLAIYYTFRGVALLYRKFRIRNTIEGVIEDKVSMIRRHISTLESEVSTLQSELSDIDSQMKDHDLSDFAMNKLTRLQHEFEQELWLKEEKLAFYENASDKYIELLSDHEVMKDIYSKKKKLKQVLSEDEIRNPGSSDHLSLDTSYIEELDYLTLRMENTVHIDEARDIQKELISIVR